MFDIYLENFLDNGQYVDNEVRNVLTIPSSDSTRMWMVNPSFKAEMGKAESFDFSVNPGSPYYNAFVQYKTLIRVVYDDTVICYARVTTVNTSGLLQVRAIHAEGIYSVLKDSQIEGVEEELQGNTTLSALFSSILSEHNSRISGDPWKIINRGVTDPGLDPGDSKKQSPTSWSDSLSAIDSILGKCGGYTRVRYEYPAGNPGGHITSYLDWKKDFFRDTGVNRPHIQVAKNLIDFSSSSEVSELFTRVIPIGQKSVTSKQKESRYIYLSGMYYPVTRICSDFSISELNSGFHRYSDYANAERNYGIIYKTLNFANADNTSKLLSYTQDWVKKNYYGALRTFTVKAIDMHMLGDSDPKILVGDCVDFTYPEYDSNGQTVLITRKLVCKSVNYNLFNPDQSSYTLGIPSDLLDFEYGEKKKTKKSSSTSAAAAKPSGGGSSPPPKVVYFKDVIEYLHTFYRSRNWVDYETSIANHAYSWRYTSLYDDNDKQPYMSFEKNGEIKERVVTWPDTPTPSDGGEYDGPPDPPKIEYKYTYANFTSGGKTFKARVLGHYRMSPCNKLMNNTSISEEIRNQIPRNVRTGFNYGVGYAEGTVDIFAFSWNDYNKHVDPLPVLFYFPDFKGSSKKAVDASAVEEKDDDAPVEGVVTPEYNPEEGSITYTDDNGVPSLQIFPDYASMKFSDAYDPDHWETDDGQLVDVGTEGAHPIPLYDEDGNRIWSIGINEPIKILNPDYDPGDPSSEKYIVLGDKGVIVSNDIAIPSIPSFRTEIAVIHDAIINRATIGELYANVATLGNAEVTYDDDGNIIGCNGVQLQTNLNGIYGVSSIFEKNADGSLKTDDEGHPIISDSYGGLSIDHDGVALGIYHAGNLTGGLMVKKINKQTATTIRGDVINLDTGVDDEGNATGHIKLTDVMTIRAAGGTTIKSDTYFDGDIYLSSGSSGGRSWSGNITASNAVIRNKIIFSDPDIPDINNAPSVTFDKISKSHVKVVSDPLEENSYILKYLPPYLDPDTANENQWIDSGNFRKAAPSEPLTATWSSRRFPLTISNNTDNIKIGFNSIYQTEKDINLGISIDPLTPPTVHERTASILDVSYIVNENQWDSELSTFNEILRYTGGILSVDATPVYNNGWNAASDITALNPVIVNSQTTKDFRLVKPKKNDPGTSQTVGYYVEVDTNYAYVKDPNDTVIAKVDNAAADRNRSSRIGNNVPNYYNVNDDEYDNASADHKFALTRYSSRYSVVTQYQKRDGTYANGDIYYVTTPADRYTDGRNDIINSGGPISQNGAVSNRAINKYVTTLTVTGINATGNISITNRQNASTEATLASSLGASSASALSNMFTSNPATYNQFYGIKVECPSASNTPQYYYFKTPVDRYDSGHSAGYNDGRNSITKSNIDVNSWSWYDSSASLPSSDATLSSMGNLIKKSKRGYVYFTVSVLNASKRYRIPINTA